MPILKSYFIDTAVFFAGCASCRELQHVLPDPVVVAASLGFLSTFVPFPPAWRGRPVGTIFCTGTFVGMSTPVILPTISTALAASALGAAVFGILGSRLGGIGGRPGAIAFVTTALVFTLRMFI